MKKKNKRIETIIIKYFSNSASLDEIVELEEWLRIKSNALLLDDFVKTNYLIDYNMLDFDTEKEIDKILKKVKNKESHLRKLKLKRNIFKYAAILLICLTIGYLYLDESFSPSNNTKNILVETEIGVEAANNKAILTLENGTDVVLEKDKSIQLKGRVHIGEKLVYDAEEVSNTNKVKYNYLTISRGRQFFVQLSDSTKVWLNSDSKLKYPVNFIKGQPRKVELVYGEAYFDVSKSTNHNGNSFRVLTKNQEIEVLGTEFNIKAYNDETNITTTLVEGKVAIENGYEKTILRPSQQSIINSENKQIIVKEVDRLFDEIAWKEGYFNFKNKSMKDIMRILSRWYDIDYVFENPEKETKKFSGVLDRENKISDILIYIQKTNEITFRIDNKTVIIE